jgi:hypothetical protein
MILRGVLAAFLATAATAAPGAAAKSEYESSACVSTQTSGSGDKLFATCVTDTGNVGKFITPSGVENLNIDSYVICDDETGGVFGSRAYNKLGHTEANLAPPTTRTATSNVRKTADGRYLLTQAYSRDATERQLIVTITLKNLGPGPVSGVFFQRVADMDAGGSTGNVFVETNDTVAAYNPATGEGMMMGVLTSELAHVTFVKPYADYNANGFDDCTASGAAATPTTSGDWVGAVRFFMGDMAAGAARTVKIFYQRF